MAGEAASALPSEAPPESHAKSLQFRHVTTEFHGTWCNSLADAIADALRTGNGQHQSLPCDDIEYEHLVRIEVIGPQRRTPSSGR